MLSNVGLPTGSTPEARTSPLLEARDLLRAAAEIEHGLLVQYLYAAYCCTKLNIRGPIAQIAKEEMGHMISVQNLILATGAHPYFGREEFPTAATADDVFPFPLTFEPLSLDSLAGYIVAESPDLEEHRRPRAESAGRANHRDRRGPRASVDQPGRGDLCRPLLALQGRRLAAGRLA